MRKFMLLGLLLYLAGSAPAQSTRALQVITAMIDSTASLNGLKSVIYKTERINGVAVLQVSEVKIRRHPYAIYVHQLSPKQGVEILCTDECRKAVINMNGFPWVNLTLDTDGSLMRKNQHHALHDAGFDLLSEVLAKIMAGFNAKNQLLQLTDSVQWRGEEVYEISLVNQDYTTTFYKVAGQENLADIARKLNINEYAILELNKECNDYQDVHDGQLLVVPTHYGQRLVVEVAKSTMLPIRIRVFDKQGLFEEYDYSNLVKNPHFAANEFDQSYPGYNF